MKKIILVILILIISTIVSGCGKPTQHVSGDGGGERSFSVKLKKKITESFYNDLGVKTSTDIAYYNTAGFLVRHEGYNELDGLEYYDEYEYNAQGNIIKNTEYLADGSMAAIYCKEYDNKDRLIFAEKKYLDEPERTKKYKYYYNNSGFCYRLDLLNYLDEIISYDLIIKDSLGRTTQTTSFCSDGTAIESDEYSYWGNTNYISSFINNYFPKNILYEWKRFYNDSWCEIRYESYYNGVLIGYDISTYDEKNRMAKIEYYTATGTLEGSCVFTYEDKALLQIERGVYLDEAGVTIDMWIIETEYYDTQDLSAGSFSLGNRRGEAQQQVFNQNRLAAIREKHYKKKGIILPQGSEDKNMD